jgi:hypothetical protein
MLHQGEFFRIHLRINKKAVLRLLFYSSANLKICCVIATILFLQRRLSARLQQ